MAEFEITIDSELIQGLLFNDRGTEELLEAVLNQVLESEMTEHLQAAPPRAHRRAGGPAEWTL